MYERIIKIEPRLKSFKKEALFLLDMINLIALHFANQDNTTEGFLHTCKNEMNDKFLNVDIYSSNDNESIHSIILIEDEEAAQHIANIFREILIDKKYYLLVEAKDIDPLEFKLNLKEREECIKSFEQIMRIESINIFRNINNAIYYYNDLLNEMRLIPDALLYESKLIKEQEDYYDELFYESIQ